jgi:SAM-dependent methyltransferase
MITYAVLFHPMHVRMYKDEAVKMAVNELLFVSANLRVSGIRDVSIGEVPYMLFDKNEPLTPDETVIFSRLTFAYALFEYKDKKLIPIDKNPAYLLNESLSSMLKYTGKTNELFTRLMLNLTLHNVNFQNENTPLNILDPFAGKGTTLYETLLHNHHAYGVEIDAKMPTEADTYLKKYLEQARFKHTSHKEKAHGATRYQITLARDKEAARSGDTRRFEIISGDTRDMLLFYKKDFFHALIADLPYGVQHASKKPRNGGGFTRNALGLLEESLPGWLKVLKPGGVIVLAWNLFLISREEMINTLTKIGQVEIICDDYDFSHRVDQAIERDVVVACKIR